MSDTVEDADDGAVGPGVPPGPSVTPGSAPPPPGPPPESGSRRGCLLVGGAIATIVLVLVGGLVVLVGVAAGWFDGIDDAAKARRDIVAETGIETGSLDLDHPPQRDIRLGACEVAPDGELQASGTLTNWTSGPTDYRIQLTFLDGDGSARSTEIASSTVSSEGLESHATRNWSAKVAVDPPADLTCRIVRIDRWPSGEEPPDDGG